MNDDKTSPADAGDRKALHDQASSAEPRPDHDGQDQPGGAGTTSEPFEGPPAPAVHGGPPTTAGERAVWSAAFGTEVVNVIRRQRRFGLDFNLTLISREAGDVAWCAVQALRELAVDTVCDDCEDARAVLEEAPSPPISRLEDAFRGGERAMLTGAFATEVFRYLFNSVGARSPHKADHESKPVAPSAQPGVYIASRASIPERATAWRLLRDFYGWNITCTWIDEAGAGQTQDLGELWSRIAAEVAAAERLILYVEPSDFPLKGALIEVGMAIAHRIPVRVVAPGLAPSSVRPIGTLVQDLGSWVNHPLVTFCTTMDAALIGAPRRGTVA